MELTPTPLRSLTLAADDRSDQIEEWIQWASSMDIEVRWVIRSVLDSDEDPGWCDSAELPKRGVIRSVSREDFTDRELSAYDDTSSRMLRQIATEMFELATEWEDRRE